MNKKLGFYQVFDRIFDKKIQALFYATSLYNNLNRQIDPKLLVKWHFNDDVFTNYSWNVEPNDSLKSLYHKRAKQLRDTYDYIIISYSGGSDCHNIVMSFLDQGLFIDELFVVMMDKSARKDFIITPDNTSAELAHASDNLLQTIPRLKEISLRSPNTKIRYVDVSQLVFDVFKDYKDASWILNMREELNPVDVTRYKYSSFAEFRNSLDRFNKVGILVGIDKPKIVIDSDTRLVYTRFLDRLANTIPIGEYITEYTNTVVEFFYWSPDACDLLCKQAHTVKQWLERNKKMQSFYETKPKYSVPYGQLRVFNERILRSILYDNWNNSWFQSDKNKRDWFTESDFWFIQGAVNTEAHAIWMQGIRHVIDNAKPYIQKYNNVPDSFIHWHKDYCIGKLDDNF